jgi:hypothetical protein
MGLDAGVTQGLTQQLADNTKKYAWCQAVGSDCARGSDEERLNGPSA